MVTPATTSRIQPHAEVAERVLLPGDPGRALRLAQWLVEAPRMLNHHRGLWGYTGAAKADGALLTIQASGTGGPSAALVVCDLATLGARRIVRVGTASSPVDALGTILVAETVVGRDGTSAALGAAAPDPGLTEALAAAGGRRTTLDSVDWLESPERATDLQSAAVLAAAARAGVPAAALVAVTRAGEEAIDPDALAVAEQELGRIAVQALGAGG